MSDILEPSVSCRYCNDLEPSHSIAIFPFDDWVSGISSLSCPTCHIVAQAIRKLFPQFLGGTFEGETAEYYSDTHVWLSVSENCRVGIGIQKDGWSTMKLDIQLYYSLTDTEEGMPLELPQAGIAGDISLISGDAPMWSFLRNCLDDCNKGHEKCKAAQDPTWYPQRLLRLTQDNSSKDILQLIETQHNPPSSPYITLSHCWGLTSPFCTTKKNMSRLRENIFLSELPRTFQDCVVVAHELGIEYIWIDSLCIIQDDRKDWARHAQCMDNIYENALFTVAAVSSSSGLVPFLGPEAPSDRDNWQAVKIDLESRSAVSGFVDKSLVPAQLKARRSGGYLSPAFFHGPLENRGWAWQERYLSVRTINFTKEEVRWHCKTSQTCECIGRIHNTNSKLPQDLEPAEDKRRESTPISHWRHIVTQYSRRQLTYSTDRLPALSGVASRFYSSLQSEYLAGLWLADFPRSLAWYRRELNDCRTGKPKMRCSLDNVVPSWSWASIDGETRWLWEFWLNRPTSTKQDVFLEEIPLESQVELISISCRPSSDNMFGEVEKGSYIKLRGRVVEAEFHSDIHGCGCVRRKGFGPQHVVPDCHIVSTTALRNPIKWIQSRSQPKVINSNKTTRRAVKTDLHSEGKKSKGPVYCLLLFTTTQDGKSHACVLILGKQAGNSNTYQRLGIGNSDSGWSGPLYKNRKDWEVWEGWEELEEWEEWERWFADAEVRTLTIL